MFNPAFTRVSFLSRVAGRSGLAGLASLAVIAVAAGGCGVDEAGGATEAEYDLIAQSLSGAGSGAGDLGALVLSGDLALGALPEGLHLEGAGRFSGARDGIDYTFEVQCRDLALETLPACTPATASALVSVTWTGHLSTPRMEADALRTGTWTMTGLQSETTTLGGAARFDLTSKFASASEQNKKTLELGYDAIYRGVVVDNRSLRWIGGQIDYAIEARRTHMTPGLDAEGSFTAGATLTFHPDGTATLIVDGGRRYEVDVRAGVAVRVDAGAGAD